LQAHQLVVVDGCDSFFIYTSVGTRSASSSASSAVVVHLV
jgi:hypothetical protein